MTDAPEMTNAKYWHLPRMIVSWLVALTMGVLVILLVPVEDRAAWFAFAIGAATLVTFALQLGTAQREGFITRTSFSVAGAVVLIAIVCLVNWAAVSA